jgi:hypothetical protein
MKHSQKFPFFFIQKDVFLKHFKSGKKKPDGIKLKFTCHTGKKVYFQIFDISRTIVGLSVFKL